MKKNNRKQNLIPHPEQHTRLYHMGLVDSTGAPELLGLEGLASVNSGCLYDDMKAFHHPRYLYQGVAGMGAQYNPRYTNFFSSLACYSSLLRLRQGAVKKFLKNTTNLSHKNHFVR